MFDSKVFPSSRFGFLALTFSALALLLAACGGKAERESAHLERGIELYEAGNYEKARLELKTVRQINPQNIDALYHLALVDRAQQDWQNAFITLSQIAEIAPEFIPARLQRAELLFLSEGFDEALVDLDAVAAVDPQNASMAALRGAILLRNDDIAGATEQAEIALNENPNHRMGVPLLVGIHMREEKPEVALAVLERAIAADPQSQSLRQLKVALFKRINRLEGALEVLRELTELAPEATEHRTDLARILIAQGKLDEAEATLEAFINQQNTSDEARLLLIDFLANQRGLQRAEAKIAEFANQDGDEALYLLTLARLYNKFDEPEKAEGVLQQVLSLNPSADTKIAAHAALAGLFLTAQDPDRASDHIAAILEIEPENLSGLLLRAQSSIASKSAEAAIIDLRTALRTNPDSVEALRLLGSAYAQGGELQLATETYDRLSQLLPDDATVLLELASLHASQEAYEQALSLVNRALTVSPENTTGLRLRGDIMLLQGKPQEALGIAQQLTQQQPESHEAFALLSRAHLGLSQPDAAIAAIEKAHALFPQMESLTRLVGLTQSAKGTSAAKALLTREIRAGNMEAEGYLLLGRIYIEEKDYQRASKSFRRSAERRPDWTMPFLYQAQLLHSAKETERALTVLNAGQGVFPEDAQIRFLRAQYLNTTGNTPAAITEYEQLLGSNMGARAANNLANIFVNGGEGIEPDLKRARELADTFSESQNPIHLDTRGWIQYKSGDVNAALITLTQATQFQADFPDVFYHMGHIHAELGNTAPARAALRKALDYGDFPDREKAAALLATLASEPERE